MSLRLRYLQAASAPIAGRSRRSGRDSSSWLPLVTRSVNGSALARGSSAERLRRAQAFLGFGFLREGADLDDPGAARMRRRAVRRRGRDGHGRRPRPSGRPRPGGAELRPAARRARPGARRERGGAAASGGARGEVRAARRLACGVGRGERRPASAVCTLPAFTVIVFTLTGLIGSPEPGFGWRDSAVAAQTAAVWLSAGAGRSPLRGRDELRDRRHRVGARDGAAASGCGDRRALPTSARGRDLASSRRSSRPCGGSRRSRCAARSGRACARRAPRRSGRPAPPPRCGDCRAAPRSRD